MSVELKSVRKEYPDAEGGAARVVLDKVDLSLAQGESMAILGTSGSGKSTLLNIIGTLDTATSGEVQLFGDEVSGLNEKKRSALRASEIGFIFQLHHLLPQCSVLENVLVPTLAAGGNKKDAKAHAESLLERIGLQDHLHKRPALLSGGERQRVAVVRALINKPRLLLADEPTGALDTGNAENLMSLLVELNKEDGLALILVTHDESLAKSASRICRLENGVLQ